jgi:hypothetical protein
MKCTRIEKFLPLYVASDLTGRRARAVESHLATCEKCRLAAVEHRASRELFRAAALAPDFDSAFYEEIRNSVLARIRRDHTFAPPSPFSRFFDARLAYAASLALLLLVAALALHSRTPRTPEENVRRAMIADADQGRTAALLTRRTPRASEPGSDGAQASNPPGQLARGATGGARRASKPSLAKANPKIRIVRKETTPGLASAQRTPSHAGRNSPPPTAAAAPPRANASEIAVAGNSGVATDAPGEVSRIEIQTSDPNIRIIWLSPATEDAAQPLK